MASNQRYAQRGERGSQRRQPVGVVLVEGACVAVSSFTTEE